MSDMLTKSVSAHVVTGLFLPIFRPDTTQESPFSEDGPNSPGPDQVGDNIRKAQHDCMKA